MLFSMYPQYRVTSLDFRIIHCSPFNLSSSFPVDAFGSRHPAFLHSRSMDSRRFRRIGPFSSGMLSRKLRISSVDLRLFWVEINGASGSLSALSLLISRQLCLRTSLLLFSPSSLFNSNIQFLCFPFWPILCSGLPPSPYHHHLFRPATYTRALFNLLPELKPILS